jgi:hypothetical protein
VKRTHVSGFGIGQAVKQNDGYAAAKKWAAKRRAMLSRISGDACTVPVARAGRQGRFRGHGSKTLPVAGRIRYR